MSGSPNTTNDALAHPLFQQLCGLYTIKIVAPGSGMQLTALARLRTMVPTSILLPPDLVDTSVPFHAHTDELRFHQLQHALYDPNPNTIIWTLRGGYGSARLIERLAALPAPKQKKIFIGFSDNTALHLFLSQHWQWQTIHGVGFSKLLDADYLVDNYLKIIEIITHLTPAPLINNLKPLNQAAKKADNICGDLTGGNLTLVQNSIGTCWQIQTTNKILFLEEVNEPGYRIDRILTHLWQAGLVSGSKAIVFGEFTCTHLDVKDIDYALNRFAQEIASPVYKTDEFGHGNKNYPLIYGCSSTIKLNTSTKRYLLKMNQ